jgi:1,4-alpha-glucan branching enzyme
MIDITQLGAHAEAAPNDGAHVRFGLWLPGIAEGFEVTALVIPAVDRFDPGVPAKAFPLKLLPDTDGRWEARVTIESSAGTSFGRPGRYLYRYQLRRTDAAATMVTRWFTDPFARATDDVGELSAFDTQEVQPPFTWRDTGWKVPDLGDLVVYELHVEEFNDAFEGVVERLPYLKSLGVSCLELMPVSSLKLDFDWGYGPLHYFAPNERWGGGAGLKRLVSACHQADVAVILDVVYQHVDPTFPYAKVYADAGLPSPMIGGLGPFGPTIDYTRPFARDYVRAVSQHWLEEYHVDGFRYDEVTDLYDLTGQPYSSFARDVYDLSLQLPRFTPSGGTAGGEYSRVIQVPEALNRPQEILRTTYSTATWQDNLLNKAEAMAQYGFVDDEFCHLLDADFSGYPRFTPVHDINGDPVDMPVAPFQYLNSHDHSHLVAFLTDNRQDPYDPLADRSRWFKLQPPVIGLYTAAGVPMLWQGQEFADNYVLARDGNLRVHFRRDVHWEYFYDEEGAPLVRLHRRLGVLRREVPALRGREFFYFSAESRPGEDAVAYRRGDDAGAALVFLNFSDQTKQLTIPSPAAGTFREMLDDDIREAPLEMAVQRTGDPITVTIPSNYGCIFTVIDH